MISNANIFHLLARILSGYPGVTWGYKSKYCEGQGSAKEYLARSSIERTLPNYSNEALCTLNLSKKTNKK